MSNPNDDTSPKASVANTSASAAFRKLHASGCFVMPNAWDPGSARFLERLGFKAIATTSAGFAFSRGVQDTERAVGRDVMLAHIKDIVKSTALPVHADFQSGYARDPDRAAENAAMCTECGVAGLSIEDASGEESDPLFSRDLAIERIKAVRKAIDATGTGATLTARCEAWLVGLEKPERTALDRLAAFAEAGADCLFAPGVRDPKTIADIVKAVAPKAVNVIVTTPSPQLSVQHLADIGVRRISLGSGLARIAWGAFAAAARRIAETGTFESLASGIPYADLNRIFGSE
ncbi:MAG TPA: isocitrate lyase/phosphoenolpyruvate mutase family protein [Bacteroidota bacterium]|nr:isocitrate lyase/phosphoenolpyruvate mutase family protein [Bacteroidota bacterium]